MSSVHDLAAALLYEGYLLYPYRSTSIKNRKRFNFGVLVPTLADGTAFGGESTSMQTECLIEGCDATRLTIEIRFLQLQARAEESGPDSSGYGAIERTIGLEAALSELRTPRARTFAIGADRTGCRELAIEVTCVATRCRDGIDRLRVAIRNARTVDDAVTDRDTALLDSLVSTHTILTATHGGFVSLIDPPAHAADLVLDCANRGTWPILAGPRGDRSTMLSSPIIVSEHPTIAPESPGDLFDATEIDEILSLRILTLSDAEKLAMRADQPARRILERTESLDPKTFLRMHGTMRPGS